jgi:competence ComEA-like helix-hairpin-helix protein
VTHPYLDSKRANAIVKYRKQHGDFKSVEDLKNIYAISADILVQIKPYLVAE